MRIGPLCALTLAALLLSAGAGATDAEGRQPFQIVGPDQGIPPAAVVSMAQDAEGFLWLGTENGLVRYEGGRHRRWTAEHGLPSAYIGRLLRCNDGGLWLATQRGLVRFHEGRVEPARVGGAPMADLPSHLAYDSRGRLWVATPRGLFRQQGGLQFELVAALPGRTTSLAAGASGAMYVGVPGSVHAILSDGGRREWGAADGVPAGAALLVIEDGQGRLWAGAGRALAVKLPGSARFQDRSQHLRTSLSPNGLPYLDRDGTAFLPTQDGVVHLRGEGADRLDSAAGLPFRWVRSVFRDREGTLWIIGASLARLLGDGRVRNYTRPGETFGDMVWFVARDQRGALLIGTDDGAQRLGPDGFVAIPGTEGQRIKALAVDRGGTLWLSSSMGPALWVRPGQERAEPAPLGEDGTTVNSVFVDSRGAVWLGHSRRGVLRWDERARRLVEEVGPSFSRTPLLAAFLFREDASGRLWVGSDAGLLVRERDGRWQLFGERDGLPPVEVRGAAILPDGSAWLHHQEPLGLVRVRVDGGRLQILERRSEAQGLRSSLVYAAQADALGRVWVTTDRGLDLLDSPLHLGRRDGIASEDCSIHALLVEKGHVWFGTSAGLVRYDTGPDAAEPDPPRARVLQLSWSGGSLDAPFGRIEPLAHRDATVELGFAAPSYAHERDLRFEVRLQGLEESFRDTDSRVVRYPALRGGRYRFEVRASLGPRGAGPVDSVEFEVRPPWWKTPWAVTLFAAAAIAALYSVERLRLAALSRAKAALERLVAERTAQLSARNGELTAALSEVKELSGMLPICMHCHKIRNDAGYWERLEKYLSARTRALFSHGLCPDCLERHYPE